MSGQLVWCLGMYGSASTWLFNAAQHICERARTGPVQVDFVSSQRSFEGLPRAGVTTLVKSHEISDDATIISLAARSTIILMTMRDPRDAVASLMAYHGHSFDKALALVTQTAALCLGYVKDRRAQLFHYETRFFDEPQTIENLAAVLACRLPDGAAQEIFNGLQRGAVEKYISGLPMRPGVLQDRISGDLLDPQTQWHSHHAGRSGEIGRWRHMLSAPQVAAICAQMPGVFNRFETLYN
jgi:hypothetical protein